MWICCDTRIFVSTFRESCRDPSVHERSLHRPCLIPHSPPFSLLTPSSCCRLVQNVNELGQSGGMFHPIKSNHPKNVSLFQGGILSGAPLRPPTDLCCTRVSWGQSGMLCLTPSRRHLAAPPTSRGHGRSTRSHMTRTQTRSVPHVQSRTVHPHYFTF